MEKKKDFDFIVPVIKLNKNDNLELIKKVLRISTEERERLGINKLTL